MRSFSSGGMLRIVLWLNIFFSFGMRITVHQERHSAFYIMNADDIKDIIDITYILALPATEHPTVMKPIRPWVPHMRMGHPYPHGTTQSWVTHPIMATHQSMGHPSRIFFPHNILN
jgi:hypothetical protein